MSNFLEDFETYCYDIETPANMLRASAYLTISSVCDKKFWLNLEPHKIDTSVYMMFVGPAGVGKSTALNIGLDLIKTNTARDNIVTAGSLSSRALKEKIESIGKSRRVKAEDFALDKQYENYNKISDTSVTICPDEAKNFFAISKEEMIGFFVEAYNKFDMYMEHLTAHHGNVYIEKPYVVFCGPCTIEWMESNFKDELLNGGFGRRCLFVYADEKRKSVPLPQITPDMRRAINRCQIRLIDIHLHQGGEFVLSDRARQWYSNWYIENDKQDNGLLQSYFGNKRMHLLKLAMLHSLSYKDELVIEAEDLLAANLYLITVENTMENVFRSSGKSEEYPIRLDIIDLVKRNMCKDITYTQIIRNQKLMRRYKAKDIKEALSFLVEQETLELKDTMIGGRTVKTYSLA
jgi:hypothetical protein